MKSLEERKKQRAEQRELLAHGGVIGLPGKDGEAAKEGATTSNKDQFEEMTIAQLKEWVKSQADGTVVVPDDVKLRDDVLKFARNYAEYLGAKKDEGGNQPNGGNAWNQQ